MFPTDFEQSNTILDKPPDMDRQECDALNVWRGALPNGQPVVVSCWKVTKEELAAIQATGRVYLMVWGGTMPPVALLGSDPFETPEEQ